MKKYLWLIPLFLIIPFALWGKTPSFAPERTVALVFSSSIHGEVEPCG